MLSQTYKAYKLNEEEWLIYGIMSNICSANGLSPVRHQAIIWIDAEILSIGPEDKFQR